MLQYEEEIYYKYKKKIYVYKKGRSLKENI